MHRPPAPRRRRPGNHHLAARHRKPQRQHQQTPRPHNRHEQQQQARPLALARGADPTRRRRPPAGLRNRAGDPRGHAPPRLRLRPAREVAGHVPRQRRARHPCDPRSVAVLRLRVYEGYGVAVSGAGARGGRVCGAGGGACGEVFGWVEGGGEGGGVDVACCAVGGVCLEGELISFFFCLLDEGAGLFWNMDGVIMLCFCLCYNLGI